MKKSINKKVLKKGKGFLREFKDFISKGNVIDLAVGVIIGGAFSGIVKNLVENIITPIISLVTGRVSFKDLFISLDGEEYATLAQATAAGASTINYGLFIQAVIDFLITAFVIFLLVKGINRLRDFAKKELPFEEEKPEPKTKICPYCKSEINIEATRCPNCTSEVEKNG